MSIENKDFAVVKNDEVGVHLDSSPSPPPESVTKQTFFHSIVDSFRQAPANASYQKSISINELRIMSLSTGLGTGLLVAAGQKLKNSGPAGLLIAYTVVGLFMMVPTIKSLSELSVAYSGMPGGFQSYFGKFIDESLAFALGWNYAIQWMCVISLELVVATMTINYWNRTINPDIFVLIFLGFVIFINFCGVRGYAYAEMFMNSIKILMLTGFCIFGLVIVVGGGPNGWVGGRYYHDPGAFTNFKGIASVFVAGAFSLGGSEFISVSAAETKQPRRSLRSASKLIYVKVVFLFLGSLVFVGLMVPYTHPNLVGSGSSSSTSPYVLSTIIHGVPALGHVINAVILVSVTSVASAAMYSSQRLIQSLAHQGLAPKWLDYVDRKGRPARAFLICIIASLLAFIAAYEKQEDVFTWLLSISALSFIFAWMFICVCHIRFRAALKYRGIEVSSLGYVSTTGVWGSYLSVAINIFILGCQFWVALWPIGGDGKPNATSFFQNYLAAPCFLVLYVGHKVWTRNWKLFKRAQDIDVDTDRVIYDKEILELEIIEDREKYKRAPIWRKICMKCLD
ncbi:General amino acid permease AGP1 [Spathaspora sp. JA1]|nr:General amino acid permease AGP1 [Spathaspora sp. JA1]